MGSPHTRGWTITGRGGTGKTTGFPAHAGMDLHSARRRAGRRGVPRTRGDGPRATLTTSRPRGGSPHTRGWTVLVRRPRPGRRGFPAHAGMDPPAVQRQPVSGGVPRTRGDGPRATPTTTRRGGGSPHTRGWTGDEVFALCGPDGFPAHAGMDPTAPSGAVPFLRVPRTRGDGPRPGRTPLPRPSGSPHTRGWTRARREPLPVLRGFPAHAGMDRRRCTRGATAAGVPRTRGDGPAAEGDTLAKTLGSPHTRGWTSYSSPRRMASAGFPAHAGMDPSPTPGPGRRHRVPRTRGDGPLGDVLGLLIPVGSPHTRGWTASAAHQREHGRGFPAHAGMDPPSSCAGTGRRRVPRTRGDGPSSTRCASRRSRGSPHTRGWTPALAADGGGGPGFPAHAGMDPRRGARRRRRPRVPRTRGDGPVLGRLPRPPRGGSPHTRGWTLQREGVGDPRLGFPAHAGMDRGRPSPRSARLGVPRTRGDGPASAAASFAGSLGSPHTRGWTLHAQPAHDAGANGFPAHAGMDPLKEPCSRTGSGVPRTRGDGPAVPRLARRVGAGSPHTRGWTHVGLPAHPPDAGFPAHAGMDPPAGTAGCARGRVPRTRGDGPVFGSHDLPFGGGSPHTRGWTRPRASTPPSARGFPAHAGMDPDTSISRRMAPRVPRTRGDGPVLFPAWIHARDGFPAHAGMDPPRGPWPPAPAWVPRTRGDGPLSYRCRGRPTKGSPHTRGWTARVVNFRLRDNGFPAHAGMDPERRRHGHPEPRVPRTRGDGPAAPSEGAKSVVGSPHTRGWTHRDHRLMRWRRGFPAHAGMDPTSAPANACRARVPRTRGDGPSVTQVVYRQSPGSPHTRGWTRSETGSEIPVSGFPAHAGMDPGIRGMLKGIDGVPRTRGDGPVPSTVVSHSP